MHGPDCLFVTLFLLTTYLLYFDWEWENKKELLKQFQNDNETLDQATGIPLHL